MGKKSLQYVIPRDQISRAKILWEIVIKKFTEFLKTKYFVIFLFENDIRKTVNCSDPTFSGEEELYTQLGFFFVQSILADRNIHRRELWVGGIIEKPVQRRIRN